VSQEAPLLSGRGAYGSFYPIQIGNRWRYIATWSKTFVVADGDSVSKRGREVRRVAIVGSEVIRGRAWFREEQVLGDSTDVALVVPEVRWLRQDATGLYEIGQSTALPFDWWIPRPRNAGSSATLLAYPLHAGATWISSTNPPITAEVEGMEMRRTGLGTFPAWRIRFRIASDPRSEVFVWYGRAGYLGMTMHRVSGKDQVAIVEDLSESLEAVELNRRRP
jgi:hypothetical protein